MSQARVDKPIDEAASSEQRPELPSSDRLKSMGVEAIAAREHVRAELIGQLYKQAPIGIIATLINSSILVFILWDLVAVQRLLVWLTVTVAVAVLRSGLILAYRNRAHQRPSARWRTLQVAALAISGLLWGSAGVFLFPAGSTAYQVFMAFVLAGMVAGAVGMCSSVLAASMAFSVPALTPILIRFLLSGDDLHRAMGVMTFLFLVLTSLTAWRINLTATELVTLKEHLAEKVTERTTDLIRANEELRREVVDRKHAQEHLRESLKEKEVLLKEIQHRVKNNLAVIISLLKMHSSRMVDRSGREAFQECCERVEAMARVHETLYQADNLSAIPLASYARDLSAHLMQMMLAKEERSSIHVVVDAEDVHLPIDAAMPCGLILNELLTNALKYAFTDRHHGEIVIAAQLSPARFELSFRDNGVGFPAGLELERSRTLGFRIISALVKHQMEGTWEIRNENGAVVKIQWPTPTKDGRYDRIPV